MGFARVWSSAAENHSSYREFQPLKCTSTRSRCASALTTVARSQSPAQSRAKSAGGFGFKSDRKKLVEATPACKCSAAGDPSVIWGRALPIRGRRTLFAAASLRPARGGTQRLGGARDRPLELRRCDITRCSDRSLASPHTAIALSNSSSRSYFRYGFCHR